MNIKIGRRRKSVFGRKEFEEVDLIQYIKESIVFLEDIINGFYSSERFRNLYLRISFFDKNSLKNIFNIFIIKSDKEQEFLEFVSNLITENKDYFTDDSKFNINQKMESNSFYLISYDKFWEFISKYNNEIQNKLALRDEEILDLYQNKADFKIQSLEETSLDLNFLRRGGLITIPSFYMKDANNIIFELFREYIEGYNKSVLYELEVNSTDMDRYYSTVIPERLLGFKFPQFFSRDKFDSVLRKKLSINKNKIDKELLFNSLKNVFHTLGLILPLDMFLSSSDSHISETVKSNLSKRQYQNYQKYHYIKKQGLEKLMFIVDINKIDIFLNEIFNLLLENIDMIQVDFISPRAESSFKEERILELIFLELYFKNESKIIKQLSEINKELVENYVVNSAIIPLSKVFSHDELEYKKYRDSKNYYSFLIEDEKVELFSKDLIVKLFSDDKIQFILKGEEITFHQTLQKFYFSIKNNVSHFSKYSISLFSNSTIINKFNYDDHNLIFERLIIFNINISNIHFYRGSRIDFIDCICDEIKFYKIQYEGSISFSSTNVQENSIKELRISRSSLNVLSCDSINIGNFIINTRSRINILNLNRSIFYCLFLVQLRIFKSFNATNLTIKTPFKFSTNLSESKLYGEYRGDDSFKPNKIGTETMNEDSFFFSWLSKKDEGKSHQYLCWDE